METLRRLGRFTLPYAGRLLAGLILLLAAGGVAGLVLATFKPLVNELLHGGAQVVSGTEAPAGAELEIITTARGWIENLLSTMVRGDNAFLTIPLLLLVLSFLRGIFLYFGIYFMSASGAKIVRDLRAELYRAIVHQSAPFFRDHSAGEVLSRVLSDVQRLQKLLTHTLANLVREVAIVPFLVIVVLIHDWRTVIVLAVVSPLLAIPTIRLSRRLRSTSYQSQETTAEVASLANETVLGIRVVQAFSMEEFEVERFRQRLQRLLRVDVRAVRIAALSPPVIELICAVAAVGLFALGAWAMAAGELDAGDFSVVLVGLAAIFAVVRRLNRFNVEIQQALPAAARVFDVFDREPEVRNAPHAIAIDGFASAIRFEGVEFAYQDGEDDMALSGIDLEIRKGEMIAIVGKSGSGKTTLANLLPRFMDPTAGRIEIDGHDLRDVELASLRAQIGLVTQETILFEDSVRNNIAYGRADIPDAEVIEAAKAAHADEFIRPLRDGYETDLGERGTRLSMGQRQRLAIARALLKNPPILILDEATSALDAESEAAVQEALDTLLEGRTSIVIAHRLSTVRRADRIIVLSQGRIVEEGDHAGLLEAGGLYARLHELQFEDAVEPPIPGARQP